MTGWTMATGGVMTAQGTVVVTAAVAARAMAKNWTRERTEQVHRAATANVIRRRLRMDDAYGLAEAVLAADFDTAHGGSSTPPDQGTPLWDDRAGD